MHHVWRAEFAHARRKSLRLLAVVSFSFCVGETKCSQGTHIKYYSFFSVVLGQSPHHAGGTCSKSTFISTVKPTVDTKSYVTKTELFENALQTVGFENAGHLAFVMTENILRTKLSENGDVMIIT